MDSHEKTLRRHGLSAQAIQSAARIAAVVHAVAITLEQSAASDFVPAAAAA
jgi:alkyl hydroperoxide reductase subunit D